MRADVYIEVTIMRVTVNEDSCIVALKEKNGERSVSIRVGILEGRGIIMASENLKIQRPFTYDFFKNIMISADLKVEKLLIRELKNHIFYGSLFVKDQEAITEHDVRPSDGLAMAILFKSPVYVNKQVFDQWEKETELEGFKDTELSLLKVLNENENSWETRISELKQRLKKAVDEELYEEAARFRDEINRIQREHPE